MKKQNWLIILLVIVNVSFIGYYIYTQSINKKVAYVDLMELFDGFNFKKERQAQYEQSRKQYTDKLDTLRLNYLSIESALASSPNDAGLKLKYIQSAENYQTVEASVEMALQEMDEKYNKEVWQKINEYMQEFGKESGFDILHGASGTGNIMYVKEEYNVTEDAIEFINKKYEGE